MLWKLCIVWHYKLYSLKENQYLYFLLLTKGDVIMIIIFKNKEDYIF